MGWIKLMLFLFIILINETFAVRKSNDVYHLEKKRSINADKSTVNQLVIDGSCHGFKCGPGRICSLNQKSRKPKCVCLPDCPKVANPRLKVCSNFNDTWQSDCHLHRHRCLCEERESEDCLDEHRTMSIMYYGECTDALKCEESVLIDFPRRMREWLYNILTSEHYSTSTNKNDNYQDLAHKWVDAVIWKYCDLDVEPEDRFVSRHELFPLRAPLLSIEPCIAEFLDKCDSDLDHKITLKEWGLCLGAEEGEIEDKCQAFKSIIHKGNNLTP